MYALSLRLWCSPLLLAARRSFVVYVVLRCSPPLVAVRRSFVMYVVLQCSHPLVAVCRSFVMCVVLCCRSLGCAASCKHATPAAAHYYRIPNNFAAENIRSR